MVTSKKVTGDEVAEILQKKFAGGKNNQPPSKLSQQQANQKTSKAANKIQYILDFVSKRASLIVELDVIAEAERAEQIWEHCVEIFEKEK